ncbi:hypothetical protein BaRGS_00021122 [Batillaria attramentaria]|uniref:Uncharacterized protein n=1 Tax=Batillaria attramentaria TaxID=370345 RepID=A0ABD0KKR4_9CAEN
MRSNPSSWTPQQNALAASPRRNLLAGRTKQATNDFNSTCYHIHITQLEQQNKTTIKNITRFDTPPPTHTHWWYIISLTKTPPKRAKQQQNRFRFVLYVNQVGHKRYHQTPGSAVNTAISLPVADTKRRNKHGLPGP